MIYKYTLRVSDRCNIKKYIHLEYHETISDTNQDRGTLWLICCSLSIKKTNLRLIKFRNLLFLKIHAILTDIYKSLIVNKIMISLSQHKKKIYTLIGC